MMTVKKSAYLVDPDLKKMTDDMQELHLTYKTLARVREAFNEQVDVSIPEGLPVEVTEKQVPGPPGAPDVRIILFTPIHAPAPRPGYLHIHGGGMVLRSADDCNKDNAVLATTLGCTVVSVDYRLAPETKHPGQVEDCYAALKWMHLNANEIGVDLERIAIGGESAGGGIAACLAVLARDQGEVNIIFQRLQSPMLDDRTCVAEPHPYTGEYSWSPDNNRFGWQALLGCESGGEGVSPYASAPRAEDLSGLPPAFISVGAIDLFVDECMDFAKRLIRAGVPTELHVYPGAHHAAWQVSEARVTIAEYRDRLEALRRGFFG
ncbi:alpha/beta hydrolase [Neobacillus pocheonensis]|uniref:alpha/beta hydrolase n=1 Tax=Neobacillus pocheonensis TaxID=363869 RepID=UPI003D28BBF4